MKQRSFLSFVSPLASRGFVFDGFCAEVPGAQQSPREIRVFDFKCYTIVPLHITDRGSIKRSQNGNVKATFTNVPNYSVGVLRFRVFANLHWVKDESNRATGRF